MDKKVLGKGMKKVIIMGAAGRDFHCFNMIFRNNPNYKVIAFTATQIPGIENRIYPKELAGKFYPKGIPIYSEEKLPELIKKFKVDEVVFAYSDVSNEYVMHKASLVLAHGASFRLLGPKETMLKSKKPVIAICATRTGAGKSPTTRKVCEIVKKKGIKSVVIRHPMPYGNLKKQICQKFSSLKDLEKYECTIEEREEYEPLIKKGFTVFAGVDYKKILKEAEKEADLIIWDGGNNDLPFIKPDLLICVTDARRVGHEISYYPGQIVLRMADIILITKVDLASKKDLKKILENIKKVNPKAKILKGILALELENGKRIRNKKVICIEDGPTLTHGGLKNGAAFLVAKKYGAKIIDAKRFAVGSLRKVFEEYSHLQKVLPAMGYGKKQIKELEETINKAKCDLVLIGTPVDLRRFLKINKEALKVNYELKEVGKIKLENLLENFLRNL